jgi:2,4-dienoyl-CoA reductase (NADPH2)
LERLTRVWMPVKKSAVIMGGTLHGCELAEFLAKRGRQVVIAHDGPEADLGAGMTKDDLENLWPWFKLKHVTLWPDVHYREIVERGLKIQFPDKRVFVLEGKNIMTTQDWGPDQKLTDELGGLVAETYVIGSCREPGWIVDAIREGALAGYAI